MVEQLPAVPATSWTAEKLAERLGKRSQDDVEDALATAGELLDQALEDRWRTPDVSMVDLMVRRLVRALLEGDSRQFTGPASTQVEAGSRTVNAPRDPMDAVRPLVRTYVVGFA